MKVSLVCKKAKDNVTVGKEYPFHFDSELYDCNGYIIEDNGVEHWMELPSNSLRFPEGEWRSSDYFSEVVTDPEN